MSSNNAWADLQIDKEYEVDHLLQAVAKSIGRALCRYAYKDEAEYRSRTGVYLLGTDMTFIIGEIASCAVDMVVTCDRYPPKEYPTENPSGSEAVSGTIMAKGTTSAAVTADATVDGRIFVCGPDGYDDFSTTFIFGNLTAAQWDILVNAFAHQCPVSGKTAEDSDAEDSDASCCVDTEPTVA
jgi:hypothetical protein